MAKHKKGSVKHSDSSGGSKSTQQQGTNEIGRHRRSQAFRKWFSGAQRSHKWLFILLVCGCILGFLAGSTFIELMDSKSATRQKLMNSIRTNWENFIEDSTNWVLKYEYGMEADEYARNPSHPRVFSILREAVMREKGGYVHYDLGMLVPAPCGAARGLGMVQNSYQKCQTSCYPGTADEKKRVDEEREAAKKRKEIYPIPRKAEETFNQEEVLLRIPLNYQMTRSSAVKILATLIPLEVRDTAHFHELDDAAILVLFLAHERGVGRYSRWMPYIASMPTQPACGYSVSVRPFMLDTINTLREELGVETEGWGKELARASSYANKISAALAEDYGSYLKHPEGVSAKENIQWALCQVTSRATAGSDKHGALRLVPIIDLINHDASGGGFIELSGKEQYAKGDFIEANEDDAGTFVVRSLRHGRRRPLMKGQELLVNYNVPHYSPLDWLISLGFVPRERWTPWIKMDPVLPRLRTTVGSGDMIPTMRLIEEEELDLQEHLKKAEL